MLWRRILGPYPSRRSSKSCSAYENGHRTTLNPRAAASLHVEEVITPTESGSKELQALLLTQNNTSTWHGGSEKRAEARAGRRRLPRLIRPCQLLNLSVSGQPAYSYLHNLRPVEVLDPSKWSWHAWLQQEKGLRLAFLAFLSDTALTIYFKYPPEFQYPEMRLPLPFDDGSEKVQMSLRAHRLFDFAALITSHS